MTVTDPHSHFGHTTALENHEHGPHPYGAVLRAARCRQPRPDPRTRCAAEHPKDVSIEIPKRRLTVFTGVSGSGKSSLAFATIAADHLADYLAGNRVSLPEQT